MPALLPNIVRPGIMPATQAMLPPDLSAIAHWINPYPVHECQKKNNPHYALDSHR